MKPKTMILMVVAVGCGLGASYMTSKLLADRRAEAPAEEQVPVLIAKTHVPGWVAIKEPAKYFEIKMLPESAVSKKSLRSFDDVKDQRLNRPLEADRQAMQDDLLSKDQKSLIDNLVPGQRAIAVKVNPESLAGGFVLPGARVDVICTIRSSDASSKIVLQSMLVLAVDAQSDRDPATKNIIGQTVTMAATPEEAARLTLSSSIGELRLMPRSHLDTKRIAQVVARVSDLDKPLAPRDGEKDERVQTPPAVVATTLPPVTEEKPAPVVETPAPVEKPRKRHVMTIINGASKEKAVFIEGEGDDEESTPTPKKEVKPEVKPEVKKEEPKPAAPVPPTFGKSPRTRR